jgi:hypothetical protein
MHKRASFSNQSPTRAGETKMSKMSELAMELSVITEAICEAWRASESWQQMQSIMIGWYEAKIYPDNQEVAEAVAATNRYTVKRNAKTGKLEGTCAVYATNILKWARSGKLPKTINECITTHPAGHVKGKGGRPKGSTGGATADAATADAAANDPFQRVAAWVTETQGLCATAVKLINGMSADDCSTLKDLLSNMAEQARQVKALVGKYGK